MELRAGTEDRVLTLFLSGELDHHAAKDVLQKMEFAIEREMPRQLVLNFAGISFMDSSGIAVVMRAQRRMQMLGGSAVVTHLPPQARKVLEAAGIGRWVNIRQEGSNESQ